MFAAGLVTITALGLLVTHDWRISIALLSIQYIGAFLFVSASWPPGLAVSMLIAGWIAGAIMGMGILSVPELHISFSRSYDKAHPSLGRLFYLLGAVLIGLALVSNIPAALQLIPSITAAHAWGALALLGLGLLKLGFNASPFPSILGLLTVLSGFEILYSSLEISALLAGLLAGITLLLALAGAYLLVMPYAEEDE